VGQTVTFLDSSGSGRGAATIGHATGGRGSLHFTAPPGTGRRTIYAQFVLAGLPAERIAVASYRPPAPTLLAPRGLRVVRNGTRITMTFKPVAAATGYEITLTDPLTGFQRLARVHGTRVVLTRIPSTVGGTLAVRAVEPRYARVSLTTRAAVKRLTAPTSKFSKLARCSLHGRKLSCKGGTPFKIKVKNKPKPKRKAGH
jgi:hypothetical protein